MISVTVAVHHCTLFYTAKKLRVGSVVIQQYDTTLLGSLKLLHNEMTHFEGFTTFLIGCYCDSAYLTIWS